MTSRIPCKIIPSIERTDLTVRQVRREFSQVIENHPVVIAGLARHDANSFLKKHLPKYKLELFDTTFYLTDVKQIPELRFYLAYIVQPVTGQKQTSASRLRCYPRIIYKDVSLAWRSASHFSVEDGEIWVGKGDVKRMEIDGYEQIESIEATTDLPLEMQTALEQLLSLAKRRGNGAGLLELVLRQSPPNRIPPYADFNRQRIAAQKNKRNLIHRGKPIAFFKRKNDPTSLKIVPGFEPDFSQTAILERSFSQSKLYGGKLKRFRILSTNQLIQYFFIAAPRHVWLFPPQATTTQLSSYGVRTIDVTADDDLFIPGYEYHHDEDTPRGVELYSQIPPGFAGPVCPHDEAKADASLWLNQISLINEFRRKCLVTK